MLGSTCSPCCDPCSSTFSAGALEFTGPLADWNCCGLVPGCAAPPGYGNLPNPSQALLTPASESFVPVGDLFSSGAGNSERISIQARLFGGDVQLQATFFGPETDGTGIGQRAVVVYQKSIEELTSERNGGFVSFLAAHAISASGTSNSGESVNISHVGKICFRMAPPNYDYRSREYSVNVNARTSDLTVDNHNATLECDRPACRTNGNCTGPEPTATLFLSEIVASSSFTFGSSGTGQCSIAGLGSLFLTFGVPVQRQSLSPVFILQLNFRSVVTSYCLTINDTCTMPSGGFRESVSFPLLLRRSSQTFTVAPVYFLHVGCYLTFETGGAFASGNVLFPTFASRHWPKTCRPIDFNVLPPLTSYNLGPLAIQITRASGVSSGSGCDVLP